MMAVSETIVLVIGGRLSVLWPPAIWAQVEFPALLATSWLQVECS